MQLYRSVDHRSTFFLVIATILRIILKRVRLAPPKHFPKTKERVFLVIGSIYGE
jgi:hypothetical protein